MQLRSSVQLGAVGAAESRDANTLLENGCEHSRKVAYIRGVPATKITELRTERTLLRAWRDEDLLPFAHLNADDEVMRWFPSPLSAEQSDAMVARITRTAFR